MYCVCVCVCVCVHTCCVAIRSYALLCVSYIVCDSLTVRVCVHHIMIHKCTCTCTFILFTCMRWYMHVFDCVCECMYTYCVTIHSYTLIRTCTCMWLCVYAYVTVHTSIVTHWYMYMCAIWLCATVRVCCVHDIYFCAWRII